MPQDRTPDEEARRAIARRGRVIAVVIAAAGIAALLAPWLAGTAGLPVRAEMLIYLAAMGAFLWAFIAAIGLWRRRNG